jgi:hypothetical protein
MTHSEKEALKVWCDTRDEMVLNVVDVGIEKLTTDIAKVTASVKQLREDLEQEKSFLTYLEGCKAYAVGLRHRIVEQVFTQE